MIVFIWLIMVNNNLVGGWPTVDLPLWKIMELKSVGMMTFPTEWTNKNVPNHQSAKYPTWESSEKWGVPSMYGQFCEHDDSSVDLGLPLFSDKPIYLK